MAKLPDLETWAKEAGERGAQYVLKYLEEEYGVSIRRLRELAQADREGRCVVLPCDPGQVVWAANSFGVSSHKIRMLVRDKDGDFACSMIKFPLEDFGRKVFLTREEAQAALRREKDG